MRKCIIFGCGNIGTAAYGKVKELYEVIAWSDNNDLLWGTKKEEIIIIPPTSIFEVQRETHAIVLLAIYDYLAVLKQMNDLAIADVLLWRDGLLYEVDIFGKLKQLCVKDDIQNRRNGVLFVQCAPCIRTHKIATAIRQLGYEVYLAYLCVPNQKKNNKYDEIYTETIPITSLQGLEELVNNNDFEYVHSSNEPDLLTATLIKTNKAIIHDCHDLSSAYKKMTPEELVLEYMANTQADGVIYTTEGIREDAIKRFSIPKEKTFVLENLISEDLKPNRRLPKLSERDGLIHCVYEGGVVENDPGSHRYFEVIFKRLAESGVHVHFYTNCGEQYCNFLAEMHPNIHYEGNHTSKELAYDMSQYDVGLCVLNVTEKNRQYLEFASPNKIQEYVNAGIPVAVGDIKSQIDFVERYSLGKSIDLSGDILNQLKAIKEIKIQDDVLEKNGLTMESRIPMLIRFCQSRRKRE